MGTFGAVSRFRFREDEGMASSMSGVLSSPDSERLVALVCANLEMEVLVLRRAPGDVAFTIFEVSWEILEVRILESLCRCSEQEVRL